MLRHILGNMSSADVEHYTKSVNYDSTSTETSPTMPLVTAISGNTAIPANPSLVLTGGIAAAVTTTAEPNRHVYNATVYFIENDDLEYSILAAFSDMETVFLACISTLLPLVIALGIAFGVRHMWRKYRERRNSSNGLSWYRGVCSAEDTVESLHHSSHSGSSIKAQTTTQILSAQDLVNGIDVPRCICGTEMMEEVSLAEESVDFDSPGNHTSKNANGNIITLTLKNNHLIVETEEQAVTVEGDKNEKFQNDNCSFVVEVQPTYQTPVDKGLPDDMTGRISDQQALVHREEIPDDQTPCFENVKVFGSTNTGLSQSDLSVSSHGSGNPSYRYGNQLEYDADHFGYPTYDTACDTDNVSWKLDGGSKWVEFDKSPDTEKTLLDGSESSRIAKENTLSSLDKRNILDESQESNSSVEHQDSTDVSNSVDTVRSTSSLQVNGAVLINLEAKEQNELNGELPTAEYAKPVIAGAILKEDAQEDTFQEQQRKLGNGILSPEHHEDAAAANEQKPESSHFVPSHRRAGSISPRLIDENVESERKKALDIYSQIKTSTKSMLPSLSPKFELLQNEVSPIEEKES